MYVIISNYGNESIALLQWAREQALQDVWVLSIDTGWAAQDWTSRCAQGQAFAKQCGFQAVHLEPTLQFIELMEDRGEFPTQKFQWCAGILKGLPIIDWLDTQDPGCESTIVLASRRAGARNLAFIDETIEESEHYGDRKVWHPLYLHSNEQRDALIAQTPLPQLAHRSLECDPCVNSLAGDFKRLHQADIAKTEQLEQSLGQAMFVDQTGQTCAIRQLVARIREQANTDASADRFDMGCGSQYGCGD